MCHNMNMTITVKAKTNARCTSVKQIDECTFEVQVTQAPEKGKANSAIIDALKDYFHVSRSQIEIKAGFTNKNKIVEIFN